MKKQRRYTKKAIWTSKRQHCLPFPHRSAFYAFSTSIMIALRLYDRFLNGTYIQIIIIKQQLSPILNDKLLT